VLKNIVGKSNSFLCLLTLLSSCGIHRDEYHGIPLAILVFHFPPPASGIFVTNFGSTGLRHPYGGDASGFVDIIMFA
jgi:hypothetical protein